MVLFNDIAFILKFNFGIEFFSVFYSSLLFNEEYGLLKFVKASIYLKQVSNFYSLDIHDRHNWVQFYCFIFI